jgi:cell division protein FtsL
MSPRSDVLGTVPATGRRPAPLRVPPPEPGADLRLVAPGDRARWSPRRRRRLVALLCVAAVGVGLFALVASHVVLTQGQFRLDRLQSRAAAEQARYERLRLRVAELEAPSRVVAAAQERLGMVPPPGVTYLSPSAGAPGPARDWGRGEAAAGDDWSRVKPELASQP